MKGENFGQSGPALGEAVHGDERLRRVAGAISFGHLRMPIEFAATRKN